MSDPVFTSIADAIRADEHANPIDTGDAANAAKVAAHETLDAPALPQMPQCRRVAGGDSAADKPVEDDGYPVHALGEVMGSAARDIAHLVRAPWSLAGQSVLAAGALAAQQRINVKEGSRGARPISLFCLTEAVSGDRKSGVDEIALKPFDDYAASKEKEFAREMRIWREDGSKEADRPYSPYILCQEPTLEALQKRLHEGRPSQGLFNDEGGQFFGGHAMKEDSLLKTSAGLSKLWDGSVIYRDRAKAGESFALRDRRVSAHLLIQPVVAESIFSNPIMMNQGILARFLMAKPTSIMGKREWRKSEGYTPAIENLHSIISNILNNPMNVDPDTNQLVLSEYTLKPGTETHDTWRRFHDQTEVSLIGENELIQAAAAKMAEQVMRIAAVIAVVEGQKEITPEIMANAVELGHYYLRTHRELAESASAHISDERLVVFRDWLLGKYKGESFDYRDAAKSAPQSTGARNKKYVFHEMMECLCLKNEALVVRYSQRKPNEPVSWQMILQGNGDA